MFTTGSRMLSSKVVTRGLLSSRMLFSSQECEPVQRLKNILQTYRKEHYSREIPTRFKKEILSPFVASDGTVQVEQLNQLLENIGCAEHRLSPEEQQVLLKEAGSIDGHSIELKKMMQLLV